MNYTEALEFIHGVEKFGMILGLDSIRELLNRLDRPQDGLKFIHIAGTNGKGSTASFVTNILMEAGYDVGLYTSPFLEVFNERISLNGHNIDDQDLADSVALVKDACQQMVVEGLHHPTEFELVTATAFVYFISKKVDYVVLEVGLGGRYDATNVIDKSLVSAIASISLDHTKVLGDTVDKVAYEKAGIIKKNGQVIMYEQGHEATDVVKRVCQEQGADLIISRNSSIEIKKSNLNNQVFDGLDYLGNKYEDLKIRMIGRHQTKNALLALNIAVYLVENKLADISRDAIYSGLLKSRWPGRMEILMDSPLFMIDGAHNLEGAQSLAGELDRLLGEEWDKTLVLGLLADKDVDGIVKILVPRFDRVIVTLPNNPRAMAVEELAYRVGMYCQDIICIEDIGQAVDYSFELVEKISKEEKARVHEAEKKSKKSKSRQRKNTIERPKKKAIIGAGSLFLVGDIRGHVNKATLGQ
nr:folylpolyglutamate synthase/dihydrofolate synthase family protein [uncultured Peptostreptococcus sp.]